MLLFYGDLFLIVCHSFLGLCLSEYISSQSQDVPSIYSCCYQYSSEILAFFIGWSWLFSQAAMVAAICKLSAMLVDQWTNNALHKWLEQSFFTHPDSLLSIAFALAFVLFVLTGLSETIVWFVLFIPVAFFLILTSFAITRASNKEESFLYSEDMLEIRSVEEMAAPVSCFRIGETCLGPAVSMIDFSGYVVWVLISPKGVLRDLDRCSEKVSSVFEHPFCQGSFDM
ncbi:AA_permease domain-containing protein [Trichonephila clavipes]|nr:AA_permease domain-containing protein [Trichonephila clavipes]